MSIDSGHYAEVPEADFLIRRLRGPGWLSGFTLLSHKFQSAGSNYRKVNGFFIPDSHLSEISDYVSYDGAKRRKRLH